ncbi:aromatic amino acid DMT transporter YddG [Acinetobacter guillouiae]|jgi:drug/metabolite transporter (DMT)-like permease|uniref:Aromatic amino acid DMT transporter YddG n=1 Tax=Acinetobacter guillouiae TaxID=106649 RepID=A0A8X8KEY2_ACIGI|nr:MULTISPECIES: aromatic amino acid DMT transporter YddG [Acinetobacter]MCF0265255.1 aromatic amino acid DMT transporter YddG [Acinetobacter guillouiae]UOH16564.1 aromatic amino acid DMT transporter YddG [Acinetobacter sp. NyZ410]
MSKNLATLIGLSAILQWSSIVGLLKKISFSLGAELAVLLMYTLSTCILLIFFKIPNLKLISKKYLIFSTLLFVIYELCFSYAIALAQTAQQAIEVSLVNYLWPGLTVAMLILFKEIKFNVFVIVGLAISLSGIILIQTGQGALTWSNILSNILENPISYILAFVGATLWSLYCVITKKYSDGHNPISFFFVAISIVLWTKYLWSHGLSLNAIPEVELTTIGLLGIVSVVMALGYAAWNIGIIKGNITILVTLSYFSPVISTLISMFILQTNLPTEFWYGVILVTSGSLVCWISTNWQQLKDKLFSVLN